MGFYIRFRDGRGGKQNAKMAPKISCPAVVPDVQIPGTTSYNGIYSCH